MASKPKIVNRMPAFVARTQQRGAAGMTKALVLGASEASVLTPIDTGNLLNSQYKSVEQRGDSIVGTVGYTAAYALPVHDPAHPQTFRRASAQKEFLAKGFQEAEENIRGVITGAIRT